MNKLKNQKCILKLVEMKIMKDYSSVRKYNILIIINEKDYLIRLVDEKIVVLR